MLYSAIWRETIPVSPPSKVQGILSHFGGYLTLKPIWASLLVLFLLTGCSKGGPAPAPPAQVQQQPPVKPLKVSQEDGHTVIEGLKTWTVLAAADGSAFAFTTTDGIWTVDPHGQNLTQWVKGDRVRNLVELTRDRLLYLERQGNQLKVLQAAPGKEPVQLGAVTANHVQEQGPIPVWAGLNGNRLTLAVYREPLLQVDLTTGAVKSIGAEPLTVVVDYLCPTPDGRYLIQQREHSKAPVRIYDLEQGTIAQPQGEYQLYPAPSPVTDQYAVLAAELDSGLPTGQEGAYLEGGTHIDVGQPDGTVTHLHPPDKLQFRFGPSWSPDGARLAIQATDGPVWVVDRTSGAWQKVAVPEHGGFSGWRGADHVQVYRDNTMYSVPIAGGAPVPVPEIYGQATLADGTLVYRPHDITGRDSVWVKRPGEPDGKEIIGGDGTYDILIPMGQTVAVVHRKAEELRMILLSY
jgi:hypothetical protein